MMKQLFIAAALMAATAALGEVRTVQGTDAVHGAGLTGNGVSTAPEDFNFTRGAGQVLRFGSVTGATNCCSGSPDTGPDGGFSIGGGTTNILGANGISGIAAPGQMFLVGVFVNSRRLPVAGSEPAIRTYTADTLDNRRYRTQLNQTFFIGDGLTGTGTGDKQKFRVPRRADTLLLGFIDGLGFQSSSGYYGDNTGELSVRFNVVMKSVPVAANRSATDDNPTASAPRQGQKHKAKDGKKSR